jgi:hypothetical protein
MEITNYIMLYRVQAGIKVIYSENELVENNAFVAEHPDKAKSEHFTPKKPRVFDNKLLMISLSFQHSFINFFVNNSFSSPSSCILSNLKWPILMLHHPRMSTETSLKSMYVIVCHSSVTSCKHMLHCCLTHTRHLIPSQIHQLYPAPAPWHFQREVPAHVHRATLYSSRRGGDLLLSRLRPER